MKKFFSLVLALGMALSLTTVAWGADLDATPSNIDTVIANASAGDTIQLAAGDYASLSIPLSLTNLTIKGGAGVNLAVLSLSKTNKGVAGGPLYGAPDGLTLDGLTIAAVSSVEGGTVLKNLTIKNCTFTAGINFGPNSSVDGLTIEKCTFSNITGQAIQFNCKNASSHYAKNIVIKDNVFDNISDNAINFSNSSAQGSVNISGNNIEVTADRAVRISAAAGAELTISNNEITDGVDNGEVIKVSGSGYAASVKDNALPTNSKVVLDNIVDDAIEVTMDASGNITDGEFYTAPTVPDGYEAVYSNGKYVVVADVTAGVSGSTTTLKNTDKYDIYAITGTTSVKVAANADITKKVTDNKSVTVGDKTTVTYTATLYADDANVYVEVDSTVATHKLTQNGAIVAYMVNLADVGEIPSTSTTVTSYVAAVKDAKCGEYSKATYANGVYMIDGKAYAAGGANWAVYNGKFVNYGGVATAVPHTYAVDTYNTADKSVATLKCSACKQVFTVLTPAQVRPLAPASYAKVTVAGNDYYIAVAATSAGSSGTLVESAETFDAGIAMYVGMSVMAAAGSAVVIGKKKD